MSVPTPEEIAQTLVVAVASETGGDWSAELHGTAEKAIRVSPDPNPANVNGTVKQLTAFLAAVIREDRERVAGKK